MANEQKSGTEAGGDGSFLGGAGKFNQAGNNAPMAGEKVSQAGIDRLPFGGPRVWIGTVVIVVALVALYMVYGDQIPGVQHVGGRGPGLSSANRPDVNPDAPTGSPR